MKKMRYEKKSLYFANQFDFEKAKQLFRFLKRDFYYENVNLYGRLTVAQFEDAELENKLAEFAKILTSKDPKQSSQFQGWLSEIGFRIIPKKTTFPGDDKEDKQFISNLRAADSYYLKEVNYIADFSVQLLLISMLWSVTVGRLLDATLIGGCLGHRLKPQKNKDFDKNSFSPFKYYLPDYNKWRDSAISTGLESLKNGNDILLMAMDLKQCFYFLKTDWKEIHTLIDESKIDDLEKNFCHTVTSLLQEIHVSYISRSKKYLKSTHYHTKNKSIANHVGLPIGLPSSRILANWELSFLDKVIIRTLRPIYYGRYVDDFLIVLNNPGRESLSPELIIQKFFVDTGLFNHGSDDGYPQNESGKKNKDESVYRVSGLGKEKDRYEFLEIQKSKLIFHFYAHEGSRTGLTEFQNELNKQASEFRFLPVRSEMDDFMDDAYDINFDGNKNKLRSVIGVKETQLSYPISCTQEYCAIG